MHDLFKKTHVTLPEPGYYKIKRQLLLSAIGEEWYINRLRSKPSPIGRPRLGKETQKKEDNIKIFKSS